ncbi:MAG TPA: urate oxidase [Acidimicrobiia bacterium]|nr:urate oxidase [Acidimicrobiia bacterium]
MPTLGANRWGKSAVRLSKVIRGDGEDRFLDLEFQMLLSGDVGAAYLEGDNSRVLPTDTTKNTVYALAQDELTEDLEGFASVLCDHMLAKDGITSAEVTIRRRRWMRESPTGFTSGGSERRLAWVRRDGAGVETIGAGIEGLVVLKTGGSAFTGFPRDEFTVLPEAEDRLLSTSITARWVYTELPADTSATWAAAREILLQRFFDDWSASVQHQGWLMAQAVLDGIPQIDEISFELPNQHHLAFDLSRFGLDDKHIVFHPVSEPYGDIRFTVTR